MANESNKNFRDFSIPFTEEEKLEYRQKFKQLPTYDGETDTIGTTDVKQLVIDLRMNKSDEQIEAYVKHMNKLHNGRVQWSFFKNAMDVFHLNEELIALSVRTADKDSNGFIDENEFEEICKVFQVHDPQVFGNISFDKFLREADTNKDGKISIEECIDWVRKQLN